MSGGARLRVHAVPLADHVDAAVFLGDDGTVMLAVDPYQSVESALRAARASLTEAGVHVSESKLHSLIATHMPDAPMGPSGTTQTILASPEPSPSARSVPRTRVTALLLLLALILGGGAGATAAAALGVGTQDSATVRADGQSSDWEDLHLFEGSRFRWAWQALGWECEETGPLHATCTGEDGRIAAAEAFVGHDVLVYSLNHGAQRAGARVYLDRSRPAAGDLFAAGAGVRASFANLRSCGRLVWWSTDADDVAAVQRRLASQPTLREVIGCGGVSG